MYFLSLKVVENQMQHDSGCFRYRFLLGYIICLLSELISWCSWFSTAAYLLLFKQIRVNIFCKRICFKSAAAAVLAILLYGCESWILTENLEKSLNSFATNCYRIMLNIRRLDKKRNEDIYKMVAQEPLAVIVQQRQLRFLGHCLRKEE